jgi:hypothetical protein
VSFFLALSFFVPWKPYFVATAGIDDSWMLALSALFSRHPRFGHDIVFTYGPWGFLHTGVYHPETYRLMLLGWTFFATAFWAGCWSVGRRRISNPAVMLVWMLAALGVAALSIFHQSATLLCMIGLLLIHQWDKEDSASCSPTSILLAAAVALASLVKFTYFAAACMVIVPITIDQLLRRRIPVTLICFALFFLGFDLLAGQRLADLPDYLCTSMQISNGYTEPMSFTLPWPPLAGLRHAPPADLLAFLAASALLAAGVGLTLWKRIGAAAGFYLVALGGVLFTTFKWGFVRHDPMHAPLAGFVLLFLALLCAAALLPRGKPGGGGWVLVLTVLAPLGAAWNAPRAATGEALPAFYVNSLMGCVIPNVRAAAALATGRSNNRRQYEEALATIRADSPAPAVTGSVDIYPWSPSVVIAAGLDYQPRPVVQSYSAYTQGLAELDAASLRGNAAPENILLSIADGDFPLDRFPTADDGPSWPQFLTRYDIDGLAGGFLRLRRSARPRHYQLMPLQNLTAQFDEKISVPSADEGPIWVQIHTGPTISGRLLSILFKGSELHLTVTTRDGRERNYRLCAASAETGFLLSPVINNVKSYERLTHHDTLPANEVATIRLSEQGWTGPGWCYRPQVSLIFSRLRITSPAQ